MKIVAMIPARIGSERLKYKNLRILAGKPVICYAIEAAKNANIFDKIIINSDENIFSEIAKQNNVDFYLRSKKLGSSNTQSDEVVFDFLSNNKTDLLVWVNPIAPLQTGVEIKNAINFLIKHKFDTVITSKKEYFHSLYENTPINFKIKEKFAKTQDLKPIQSLVYSLMMWNSKSFIKNYNSKGFGMLSGNVGFFEVDKKSTVKLNYEEDLEFCEAFLKINQTHEIKYHPILEKYLNSHEK
jgi:CMP-N-acetylneuraminic acid synthetase